MNIYENKKIGVKSWNNYSPYTHLGRGGRIGAYSTYLAHKDNYSWMRNWSMGPLNTKKKSYCLKK